MKTFKTILMSVTLAILALAWAYHIIFQPPYFSTVLKVSALIIGVGLMVFGSWFVALIIRDGDKTDLGPIPALALMFGAGIVVVFTKIIFF
ncbi:hypothetical protein MKX72_20280 [Priestia sp. FSL R5-0597]|uniref:hypothetical protein n=1 Tax=Priestia sp. FSL R5-0597 TaxID=2921580 RepID=UPI0030FB34B9